MPKFPVISGKRLIKILQKFGYEVDYIHGSHHVLRNSKGKRVTVPVHGSKEIPTGTVLGILSDINITKDEFIMVFNNKKIREIDWGKSVGREI